METHLVHLHQRILIPGLCLLAYILGNTLTAAPVRPEVPGSETDPRSSAIDFSLCDDLATSTWHGFKRVDFVYDTRRCTMVMPAQAAAHRPWIWRARFFGHEPQADLMLLQKGFHLVYMDVAGLFGSPTAVKHWDAFYAYLTEVHHLNTRVALEGMSRGGLIVYNWAKVNPQRVACIYADNPVCDFKSWPAGQGRSRRHDPSWQACLQAYGLSEVQALAYQHNPVDDLEALARAVVPILHVCGTADTVVPIAENSDLLEQRYKKLGGKITVIRKPGLDHHPHSLEDPRPIVKFIQTYTAPDLDQCYHNLRAGLKNCRIKFVRQKQGRVAFLGGSITYNSGWRNYLCDYLRRRFPDTQFEFIAAGIPSTGSTPGAFRLVRDVFKNGPVDLLFEEAAVNDASNGRSTTEQIRGMEGLVRHARALNPKLDVILMHFVDPEKMAVYGQSAVPVVIRNHEQVAEHYQLPSLNLALEVTERIRAGQFDWTQDFRNLHPSAFGQNIYFRAMKRMLEVAWTDALTEQDKLVSHPLPQEPLDRFCYDNGRFMSIYNAELGAGFSLDSAWRPTDGAGTRSGFVNVPVLQADRPGARLKLRFAGRAIGLFVAAGPDAGMVEYSVDGAPYGELNLFTRWSARLHLPWAYVLGAELGPGVHELRLRVSERKHAKSRGHACRIVHFLVN
jgi:sialidase-1